MDSGIQTHDLRVSSHNQLDQGSSWRMFVKKPTPTLMAFTVPSPQPTACRSPKCSLMTATGSNQARPKARFKPNSLKKSGVDGGSIRCPRWRLLLLYIFLKKMGQSWPLFPFIFVFSTCHNSNLNWKKRRWCAWDSNPGRQDGRRKRIHWATAAPQTIIMIRWSFTFICRFTTSQI